MKTMTASETVGVNGGIEPISAAGMFWTLAMGAVAYAAKDIYDNWGSFKEAVADGWNNV